MSALKINVRSEIGKLDAVLLHTPGAEVENMTPQNVQRALYSDILNLSIAKQEYAQLSGVLGRLAKIYTVSELLEKVLDDERNRQELILRICLNEDAMAYYDTLMSMTSKELARVLIEGLPAKINTLTSFLRNEYYALYPLYNFYFTRDAAVTIGNTALICSMANKVRVREALIMNAIYSRSGAFDCEVIDAEDAHLSSPEIQMEGGDILVLRDDILLVGNGVRTSTRGIDFMIENFRQSHREGKYHLIVQQLPSEPESFIHLDMVFTMLDRDKCMIFEPLIMGNNAYQTVHITIEDGRVSAIRSVPNILKALKRLGMDLEPVICGGDDEWDQEREQWHSGANTFAFAPGQILTYGRNIHTLERLDRAGFELINAMDFIKGGTMPKGKCVIAIEGSELPRGGGGARCMTMPLSRQPVEW